MKITKLLATATLLLMAQGVWAQAKKPAKPAAQQDMDKLLQQAMDQESLSKEDQEAMKKMMKGTMPTLEQQNAATADYGAFSDNKTLIPKKDPAKKMMAFKTRLTSGTLNSYATGLYTKLMAKSTAKETELVKKLIAQSPKASQIAHASVLAMWQGHTQTAMALALKAVQTDPSNPNWQNNAAALLTSYGYPEQAMPLLEYVNTQQPDNSTVLNNLAYAWLGLGEIDSAKRYVVRALALNPQQPEAQLCGGVINELIGDPIRADENYTNAQSLAPNPFTQQVKQNNKKGNAPLDWNKIRKSIAIHNYFPANWIVLPKLANHVDSDYVNLAWQDGFKKMVDKLEDNIEAMTAQTEKELDDLVDQGDDAFVAAMASSAMKGQTWMSKPAAEVLKVLTVYEMQRTSMAADSIRALLKWKEGMRKIRDAEIKRIYKKIDDNKGTSCKSFKVVLDSIDNSYMATVNARLGNYLTEHAELHRQWLNAYITWSYYVAGNPKNVMLMHAIQSAGFLAATYKQVVEMMEYLPPHCSVKTQTISKVVPVPMLPNLTCSAIVKIPGGKDWLQLSNSASNFDAAGMIKKATDAVPNMLVSYGVGPIIAQAGMAPSVKTGNGSITPVTGNDDELASIPWMKGAAEGHGNATGTQDRNMASVADYRKAQLAKELMKQMTSASCNKPVKKKVSVKVNPKTNVVRIEEADGFTVSMGEVKLEPVFEVAMGELFIYPVADASKVSIKSNPEYQKIIDEVKMALTEGLQPTISSGLQLPGIIKADKNLFQ